MERRKVALVGVGRWGKKLLNNLSEIADVSLICYRGNPVSKAYLESTYPSIPTTYDINDVANNPNVSAVFIVTPIASHADLVQILLEAGKHVFVEKPLSSSVKEVARLHQIAKEKGCLLYTGYIYLIDDALLNLQKDLGPLLNKVDLYWDKWGSFDSSIVDNLLVHEISISTRLLGNILDITNVQIQSNQCSLTAYHERGTSNIHINRESRVACKKIHCQTSDSREFLITDGCIYAVQNETKSLLFQSDNSNLLARECRDFLDKLENTSIQKSSLEIDLNVATALTLIKQKIS